MVQSENQTMNIVKRLQNARIRLLQTQPFYAILLMCLKFALDGTCERSYTDGHRIAFNPDFVDGLDDGELEFVLMHEVLHVALGHPFRNQRDYDQEAYDIACDIVVNSNILYSFGMDKRKITLKDYGEAMHLAPDGKEGHEYTVEQVYAMVCAALNKPMRKKPAPAGTDDENQDDADDEDENQDQDDADGDGDGEGEGEGKGKGSGKGKGKGKGKGEGKAGRKGKAGDGEGDGDGDGDGEGEGEGKGKGEGSGKGKGKGKGKGEGKAGDCSGGTITGSGQPNKDDPTEEDLAALIASILRKGRIGTVEVKVEQAPPGTMEACKNNPMDDHSFWEGEDDWDEEGSLNGQQDLWRQRMIDAAQTVEMLIEKEESHKGYGGPPALAERLLKTLRQPEVDWRALLQTFVQEEINDYSFSPPDRRFDDSPFFLPDYNEKEESVKHIWFLIDTSGSIGNAALSAAYSEIVSAIEMFNNKLEGMLSFTEVFVTDPVPFCSVEELLKIRPVGCGGNDFGEIFRYMKRNMMDDLPASIVILTDGYDYYPVPEEVAMGVPVLWLINNEEAEAPPWGRWARFKIGEEDITMPLVTR